MLPDDMAVLKERRAYLAERIKAKQSVGWEFSYDEREHRALSAAILELEKATG